MGAERKAIVLGGNADQVPLIQALGARGYRTVLIDYYPDPPGKEVADVHHQVSTLDVDAVCRVVEAERPTCILDSAEDHHEGSSQYVHQFINSRSSEALHAPWINVPTFSNQSKAYLLTALKNCLSGSS